MLGLIIFIAVIATLAAIQKGASIYRILFDLAMVGFLGVFFLLPLIVMGTVRELMRSAWFVPVVILYYLGMMVVGVLYVSNRDRFYTWLINKFR